VRHEPIFSFRTHLVVLSIYKAKIKKSSVKRVKTEPKNKVIYDKQKCKNEVLKCLATDDNANSPLNTD